MTAKTAATFGAAFGGAVGGVIAAGTAQYLCGDEHYLPLIVATSTGAVISGLATFLVARGNLEPIPRNVSDDAPHPC